MLQRTEIDGQGATVAYLTNDWTPVDQGDEDFIKVTFDDGRVVFAYPSQALRDYDPDEPRDEVGRWTTGGGKAKQLEGGISSADLHRAHMNPMVWANQVNERVLKQADADGYPARHIEVHPEVNANVLAGANYNTLAQYDPSTGKIQFFADTMKGLRIRRVWQHGGATASHEIMHAKTTGG
jgi:hypothetical protein